MQTHHFTVTGMSCAACAAHIEKAVNKLDGIESAQVNLLTKQLAVTYNPDSVDIKTIMHTVEKSGYGIAPPVVDASENSIKHTPRHNETAYEDALPEKQRFIHSLCMLLPLMYVSMAGMLYLPLPTFLQGKENALSLVLTQFLLTLPVLAANRNLFLNGFIGIRRAAPNMNSLIAVGSGSAVIYGVFALYRVGYGLGHGEAASVMHYVHNTYFESAAMILTLMALGRFLEARAKKKTTEAIEKLIHMRPQTAHVIRNGKEETIAVSALTVGDAIIMRPGQTVPVDGVIIEGNASLDESAITGESIPVEKTVGDSVVSASHNLSGSFIFRAEKVGKDTTLERIIALVEQAASSKAPIARLADVISGYFVPVVMLISLASFIGWLLAGAPFDYALSTALSVLVISCPCALGLATPTAIMAGTGRGAQLGILIRSAEGLERACRITAVLLDKTGTVTEGHPSVQHIETFSSECTEQDILQIAYSLEYLSEHPLAHAIIRTAEEKNVPLLKINGFTALHGKGIYGTIAEDASLLNRLHADSSDDSRCPLANLRTGAGNTKLLRELSIPLSEEIESRLTVIAETGASPLLITLGQHCVGLIAVADTIKTGSIQAIADFHAMDLHTVMLTGDNQKTAETIQQKIGIHDLAAELLPEEKKEKVAYYRSLGFSPAFIGDGINDAPALTEADVGIAVASGTDIALESADIVLMNNNLQTAVSALKLSKAVMRIIKENLFWALFYNALCIPLAAGVFYALFGIRLKPLYASAAMSFSSVSVVLNALRLHNFHPTRSVRSAQGARTTAARNEKQKEINIHTKETAIMNNVRFTIEGMACSHCTARVTEALNAIEGVSATVDLETKTAAISYPPSATIDMLKAAVTAAGYSVTGIC